MNLLIAENPMIVCPTLAVRIGLQEAIFLQQVHFLTLYSRNIRDGYRWVYNTYEDWLKIFPFFENEQKIGRYVRKLEDLGLLVTSKEYNRNKLDKRKWYRVNYASDLLVPEVVTPAVEDSNMNVEDSNLNVEDSNLNVEDSNLNVEDSNLKEQYTKTYNKDLQANINPLRDCDGGSPAASPTEEFEILPPDGKPAKKAGRKSAEPNPANVATWKAYAAAYRDRYGVLPAANAKTRGQAANLVRMVGADLAPGLAAYYLTHNGGFFVQCRHDFGLLLKSYQQILTDMQRGEQMTQTRARQTERTQTAVETHKGALAILQAKGLV